MAGLAKKASIKGFDPNGVKLRKRSFDRVFAQDIFHRIEDKQALLSTLANALKPKSQLLFTDFLLAESAEMEPQVSEWAAHEPEGSEPWSVDRMTSYLEEVGLTVRIAEDQTTEFRNLVLECWGEFLDGLQRGGAPEHLAESVLAEAELWSACIEAMDRSVLRS
jgi:SAM-dependent methyltransferase